MRVFLAPLTNLRDHFFDLMAALSIPLMAGIYSRTPPDYRLGFLAIGTIITIIIVFSGIYLTFIGAHGDVELDTPLGKIKTGVVGIGLVFIGSALYLGIGKIITGQGNRS